MLTLLGRTKSACDGVSRRALLQAGGAGLLGLNLPRLFAAEAQGEKGKGQAKSVIFMFLFGGPSQLETLDMKPDAPEKIRGPFKPIACRTPGLQICEHLPQVAQISNKFAVIRSMTHTCNDHSTGGHYIQTGHRWHIPVGGGFNATARDWPSMGSVVEYCSQSQKGALSNGIPNYAVVPNSLGRIQKFTSRLRRPGEYAGWLGRGYDPFTTAIDKKTDTDNPYFRNCSDDELNFQIEGLVTPPELTLDRLESRRSLLEQYDHGLRAAEAGKPVVAFDQFRERAWSLVASDKTRKAFDVRQEKAETRDRYGRNLFGQATLMARRLIEAGTRFATVHWDCPDGYSWDSHTSSKDVEKHLLPGLDSALSALLIDLEERGLLDETLVVCMGEMGRTPMANAGWGRSHWSTLFPAIVAGAGVRGGILYGASDKDAAYPVDDPVSPEDLAATIYTALGIDPHMMVKDNLGRPVPIVEGGRPLMNLFG